MCLVGLETPIGARNRENTGENMFLKNHEMWYKSTRYKYLFMECQKLKNIVFKKLGRIFYECSPCSKSFSKEGVLGFDSKATWSC